MKTMLRWAGRILVALLLVVILGALFVYLASERVLRKRYDVPPRAFAVPTDSLSAADGQRLATIRGCYAGCHGKRSEGGVFIDEPVLARLVAPDLTASVRRYSDAELERIVRQGVRPDGRSVLAMPSEMFHGLSDEDLGKILAFIRSLPAEEGPGPDIRVGPLGRLGVVMGQYFPAAALIDRNLPTGAATDPRDTVAYGGYLASTTCTECHGLRLQGAPDGTAPDLRIAGGYRLQEFAHLMRTGEAQGGRRLKLMREVAESRFAHFTEGEVAALFAYLQARAATPDSGAPAKAR